MSENGEFADLYSAIEESARVHEVPYAHDKVRSVLTAYQDTITPATPIAFRMGTGARYSSDVDWRFPIPVTDGPDPYTLALQHGLLERTDHPVSSLYGEVLDRCKVHCYGIDFGAASGLNKLYVAFPPDNMEPLSKLLDLPSMPPSVAANHEFFARHDMDRAQMPMFAIDYRDRTVNVYFNGLSAKALQPDSIRSIFRDLELPEPSERVLKLSEQAIGAYATLSWDSSKIERFAFTIPGTNPADLPVEMEPEIAKFLASIGDQAIGDRFVYYVAMSSTGEEIYKFQVYYQFKPWLDTMMSPGSDEQPSS
ncbi:aromatic prenyltransferase [Streptomyces sp. NPDC029674]|uniref:aromatic prenyltransferase n=1 Tax=Streptomyces sp. NPDC029674 TaxID=3365297 RepID=UPI00384DE76E